VNLLAVTVLGTNISRTLVLGLVVVVVVVAVVAWLLMRRRR
jgi:hypothetical protein